MANSGNVFHLEFEVVNNTDEFMQEVDRMMPTMLKAIGEEVEGYAKEDCPVDTGLLHNSITYAIDGETPNITDYSADRPKTAGGEIQKGSYSGEVPAETEPDTRSVYVGSNVKYAEAVEMREADHKVGKAHFLRDAFQNNRNEIKDLIETFFKALQ